MKLYFHEIKLYLKSQPFLENTKKLSDTKPDPKFTMLAESKFD